jgi:uncharacterized protein YegP (UPF0339 family)
MKVTVYRDKSGEYRWKLAAETVRSSPTQARAASSRAIHNAKHGSCSLMRS